MMNAIIVTIKATRVKTINFSIEEENSVTIFLDNIRIISSSIC